MGCHGNLFFLFLFRKLSSFSTLYLLSLSPPIQKKKSNKLKLKKNKQTKIKQKTKTKKNLRMINKRMFADILGGSSRKTSNPAPPTWFESIASINASVKRERREKRLKERKGKGERRERKERKEKKKKRKKKKRKKPSSTIPPRAQLMITTPFLQRGNVFFPNKFLVLSTNGV